MSTMQMFVGKFVFRGQGSSISFGEDTSYSVLCERIRSRLSEIEKLSFKLKFSVHPDTTVFQLENDIDMVTLFKVMDRYKNFFVDFEICVISDVAISIPEPTESGIGNEESSSFLAGNEYLGCFRREEPKFYMSNRWKELIGEIGQSFEGGVKEFRVKLRMYAIEVGFEYCYETNKPHRVIAVCKKKSSEGCTWMVKASLCRWNGYFQIYALSKQHQCRCVARLQRSNMLSSEIVKEVMLDKVRDNPNSKAIDIQNDLKLNYELDVPYHKAWYGKELAKQFVIGDEAESYRHLPWFGKSTFDANPGSSINIECATDSQNDPQTQRFRRMFVTYGALLKGFQHCRPVLHIDATFLTNKYRGMLLAATAKDANCGMYPVAYAIVDSETESNWIFFLKRISDCLSTFPARQITFISDRNLGLLKVVKSVFPNSPMGFCYRHLHSNLSNKYPAASVNSKSIPALFMACAYSRTREYFEFNLENLKREGGGIVSRFLEDLPLETWASCYFNGERFGEMTNNLAECFNSWIKDLKGLPIVEFNVAVRVKIMSLIAHRNLESAGWVTELCPKMEKKLAARLEVGRHWIINRSSSVVFEVKTPKHSAIVHLGNFTCSCGEWEVEGFPCSHALVVIQYHGSDIYSYINSIFKVGKYCDTYSFAINPVCTISKSFEKSPSSVIIHPPITKRPAGRPRVERFKSRNEVKRIVKCGRCKKFTGHNRKTCKEVI